MNFASQSGTSSTQTPRQTPHVSQQWADALHAITTLSQTPPIAVICGPKNSGKSTFSRLLINCLLERYDRLGYLDTDVGQPEFFLPGCLSLHIVDECLVDLMSTSIREPERCFFFGDISSKRDPEVYINHIFRLYDYFLENFHQSNHHDSGRNSLVPLIINTAGWVKGTGFDVLVELLRYVSPTYVVQIRISAESKNLPTGAFWSSDEKNGPSELIEVPAVFTDMLIRSVLMRKNAHSMRDLRLSEYFKQCCPSSLNICTNKELARALASIPPYQVHFSQVKVMHLHCQVPKHEVFHSLNATIVGLAASSSSIGSTPCCVGLGIVRSIDAKKGVLYVITPVSLCKLEEVDILFQGFIEIPTSLLQLRGCVSPYMSANVLHKLPAKDM
ncbi:polynucleotide 5'-hydroxyl-kinase NOL9 [Phalaenopsis equestris]|uniref:polynucleotide 5'-hydroxyl-kinase NOL9 n=1 Tax=Phalaenopsis equestris TaxID=78828 RepID=UPI0009E32561|nr:polynucleotide 5'-hydroxyl-kinase NOL9 [Phalaenopsis equestris]XP_020574061.1 polynucleotide 5'-hydroxyl-kinase NOL9 [Phalaenopsis equestris]